MILAAFEHWGVEEAVGRFNGMFVIVCWDTRERRLHLMRDPLGIKPLYLGLAGRTLLWGSELKALQAHPEFAGRTRSGRPFPVFPTWLCALPVQHLPRDPQAAAQGAC